MDKMKFFVMVCVIFFPFNAFAEEVPIINLLEGSNEIVLSIKNNWSQDRGKIETIIDQEKLPHWMTVSGYETVNSDGTGKYSIILNFTIEDAPSYAMEDIPLVIKDDIGNQWNFTFSVKVVNDNSSSMEYALYDNYPNPFNPYTSIKYSLEKDGKTRLIIFNSVGQKVRTLVDEVQPSGIHIVQWDSKDDQGLHVPSGIYFYMLQTQQYKKMKKMILLK